MSGFLRGKLSGGKWERELKELQEKIADEPKNFRLRVRMGDFLEKMGRRDEALETYRLASEEYARNGFLIQAIAVNKLILRLDPDQTGIHERIADLYAQWGKPEEEISPSIRGSAPSGRGALPVIPLFSELGRGELTRIMEGIQSRKFARGKAICEEGDPGDSLFIICRGSVAIYKEKSGKGKVLLNHLGEGNFFGEFGFFANSCRQATVEAQEETEVLEITKTDLQKIMREFPSVSRILFKFYRDRVLDNLLTGSSLFRTFSPSERREILEHTTLQEFPPGAMVVREGDVGDSLYIIKSGEVEVATLDGKGNKLVLARLKEGDYFGEISLLTGRPRTATVEVIRPAELVGLSHRDFHRFLASRPEARRVLEGSLQERLGSKLRMLGVSENNPAKEGMI